MVNQRDERLLERLAARKLRKKSELYRWLYERREVIAAYVATPGRSWERLADEAKEAGIETSRQRVFDTWRAVERDMTVTVRAPSRKNSPDQTPLVQPVPTDLPDDDIPFRPVTTE